MAWDCSGLGATADRSWLVAIAGRVASRIVTSCPVEPRDVSGTSVRREVDTHAASVGKWPNRIGIGVSTVVVGMTDDLGGWLTPDTRMRDVRRAVLTLLGPAITEHVVAHVDVTDRDLETWVRGTLVSQVLRDEGMRRYSDRLRGLVPFGPIDVMAWRDRRDLSRRNAFLNSDSSELGSLDQ